MVQRREGLLQARGSLAVSGARGRLGASLAQVVHSLCPELPPQRVVREALDVLGEAAGMQSLDGLDNTGVQRPAAILEQAPISDLVGQRVLEGVFDIREQAGLVEELSGLQVGETLAQPVLAQLGD